MISVKNFRNGPEKLADPARRPVSHCGGFISTHGRSAKLAGMLDLDQDRQRAFGKDRRHKPRLKNGIPMLAQPDEPNREPGQPARSKAFKRWMGVLFLLGTLAFIFMLFYVIGLFS
jgi:hypothetical protein